MNSSFFTLHLLVINVLYVVHERLVAKFGTTWGWIMTGEIPVALVVRYRLVQSLQTLEYELDWGLHTLWTKHLHNLLVDFLCGEWLVDGTHWVHLLLLWFLQLSLASLVGLLDEVFHLAVFQKLDSSTEHAELFQSRHVDAVIIRITNLRRTRYHYYLLRMQAVENTENTLLQGCTTHDTIVDDDEVIYMWLDASVGYIIYVTCQVVAAVALSDEGTQLDILPSNFL